MAEVNQVLVDFVCTDTPDNGRTGAFTLVFRHIDAAAKGGIVKLQVRRLDGTEPANSQ
jgi:hypothetical protein